MISLEFGILEHIGEKGLQELSKQNLLCGDNIQKLEFFQECVLGKDKRLRFTNGIHTTQKPLDYVHSYLWEPSRVQTYGGGHDFLSIIDYYSRRVWVYTLKLKSDAFNKFIDWHSLTTNQKERKLKFLRTENGLEFLLE